MAGRVGRYEVLRTLGQGGMATVYLARQTDLDRHVALKKLRLLEGAEPQLARRFLREARLAGSFSHPNIVTVHDYFEDRGTPYIAMEYLSRGSLRPYVGRLSLAQIGGVLEGVLAGLAHAEERGVVHRDLKPENLMVSAQGSVKIADFGIAKAAGAVQTGNLTTTGTTLGTPRYMAPERALGQEVGAWSDLYSIGVIVFELLVGRTPFHDTDAPMAILMRQINDPVPPVTSLVPDVDPAISDWVERLLVKDPAERTRSAATAWEELDGTLVGLLGPRWLQDAGLPARPGQPAPRGFRTPVTVPRADSEAVATMPPATVPFDPEPVPQPAARRRRRRRGRPFGRAPRALAALALFAGIAAMLGGGGGGAGGETTPTPAGRAGDVVTTPAGAAVMQGAVTLSAPSGWRQAARAKPAGLPLSDAITLKPTAGADGRFVTAGRMAGDATDALRALGVPSGDVPPPSRVVLPAQGLEARRYRGLRPAGSTRPLTLYVVPTGGAVATVACLPGTGQAGGLAATCESIARTLRIAGAGKAGAASGAGESGAGASGAGDSRAGDSRAGDSGVGDSKSDDPSDDEPDDNGD